MRPLTIKEKKLAESIYGNSIDYSIIAIKEGGLFGNAFAYNDSIYFPRHWGYDDRTDYNLQYLVHELQHVRQYQKGIFYKVRAVFEQIFFKDPYKWDFQENKGFEDYRIEQQARIMQDFYKDLCSGKNLDGYQDLLKGNINDDLWAGLWNPTGSIAT